MADAVARAAGLLAVVLSLSACGPGAAPPSAGAARVAIKPADVQLAKIFEQSCAACHASVGNPAPQAGDAAAWSPRLAQGEAQLLAHTLNGYKGMPPLGSCGECSEEEFTALIAFMARGEGAAAP